MSSEKAITDRILKRLNALPECVALKYHGSPYTRRGHSDIHGCYKGRAFFLEVKEAEGRATVLQEAFLRRMEGAGARVGVVRSVDEALVAIAEPPHSGECEPPPSER